MNHTIELILTAVISSGISGVILAWLLQLWVGERLKQSIAHEYDRKLETLKDELIKYRNIHSNIWQIKMDACRRALNVANSILSNYEYKNVQEGDITKQYLKTEEARACLDELACTCESSEVLDQVKNIMFNKVSPDSIVDLRNAVRRELGFSNVEIDKDREKAFVGKVNCHPPEIKTI